MDSWLLNWDPNIFWQVWRLSMKFPTVPFNSVLLPKKMIEPKNIWLFTAYLTRCSNVFTVLPWVFFQECDPMLLKPMVDTFWNLTFDEQVRKEWSFEYKTHSQMVESLQKQSVRHCWSSKVTPFGMDLKPYDNALRNLPSLKPTAWHL